MQSKRLDSENNGTPSYSGSTTYAYALQEQKYLIFVFEIH